MPTTCLRYEHLGRECHPGIDAVAPLSCRSLRTGALLGLVTTQAEGVHPAFPFWAENSCCRPLTWASHSAAA